MDLHLTRPMTESLQSDVDALTEELSVRICFAWGPETMYYGVREFEVRDPNGYFIAFAMPAH